MFGRQLCLLLVLCTFATSLHAADPRAGDRVWTDRQGRQVVGRLIRVADDHIVLNVDGVRTSVPLAQLSDDDHAFLRGDEPAAEPMRRSTRRVPLEEPADTAPPALGEPRTWTINDRQIVGAWRDADEQGFTLETGGKPVRIAYTALTAEEDAVAVVQYLTAAGRGDIANEVKAIYEQTTGQEYPAPASTAKTTRTPIDDDLPPEDEPPVTQSANVVEEIVDPILPSDEPPKYRTADQAFAEAGPTAAQRAAAEKKFRNTVIWGGITLFAVVGGVIVYGWMTMRKAS